MNIKTYREKTEKLVNRAANTPKVGNVAEGQLSMRAGSAKQRVDMIETTDLVSENMEAMVPQYLKTIEDKNEAVSVRISALNALKAAEFLGPQFDKYRENFHQSLRNVSEDRSPKIREGAIEVLAISNDSYIQEKLISGLKKVDEALVSTEKAIQYLSYDEHSQAVSLVRDIFDDLGDRAKEQAVQMLAADPNSEELLASIMVDKAAKSTLRCLSAVGLKNLNPSSFKNSAKQIISNDTEFDEIKAVCISALANSASDIKDIVDDSLLQNIKDIKTKSRNLRSSVNRFIKLVR